RRIEEELARPVLFLDYMRRAQIAGRWNGDAFELEGAIAPIDARDFGIPAGKPARVRVSSAGVTFVRNDGVEGFVAAPGPILSTPGLALAPQALAALGPTDGRVAGAPSGLPAAFRPGVRAAAYKSRALRAACPRRFGPGFAPPRTESFPSRPPMAAARLGSCWRAAARP